MSCAISLEPINKVWHLSEVWVLLTWRANTQEEESIGNRPKRMAYSCYFVKVQVFLEACIKLFEVPQRSVEIKI